VVVMSGLVNWAEDRLDSRREHRLIAAARHDAESAYPLLNDTYDVGKQVEATAAKLCDRRALALTSEWTEVRQLIEIIDTTMQELGERSSAKALRLYGYYMIDFDQAAGYKELKQQIEQAARRVNVVRERCMLLQQPWNRQLAHKARQTLGQVRQSRPWPAISNTATRIGSKLHRT
jgi:hypothetical protein